MVRREINVQQGDVNFPSSSNRSETDSGILPMLYLVDYIIILLSTAHHSYLL